MTDKTRYRINGWLYRVLTALLIVSMLTTAAALGLGIYFWLFTSEDGSPLVRQAICCLLLVGAAWWLRRINRKLLREHGKQQRGQSGPPVDS